MKIRFCLSTRALFLLLLKFNPLLYSGTLHGQFPIPLCEADRNSPLSKEEVRKTVRRASAAGSHIDLSHLEAEEAPEAVKDDTHYLEELVRGDGGEEGTYMKN